MSGARPAAPAAALRLRYLALAVATIVVGLGVHLHAAFLAAAPRDVLGDALWAAMIVWWVSAVAPHARRGRRGAVALAVCWAVELGQRVHGPALDAVRGTLPGHLVLGSGFDPRDLAAYAAGVAAALLADRALARRRGTRVAG